MYEWLHDYVTNRYAWQLIGKGNGVLHYRYGEKQVKIIAHETVYGNRFIELQVFCLLPIAEAFVAAFLPDCGPAKPLRLYAGLQEYDPKCRYFFYSLQNGELLEIITNPETDSRTEGVHADPFAITIQA